MGKRLKLRRDHPGLVFIGSYESNQPERVSISQKQPYVDVALSRKAGWNDARIVAELPKYLIYVPEILYEANEDVPRRDRKPAPPDPPAKKPAPPAPAPEAVAPTPAPPTPAPPAAPPAPAPEAPPVELPSIQKLKAMTRGDLTSLAEQLDAMDDIVGTGQEGYVTVPNIRDHLIEIVRESRK